MMVRIVPIQVKMTSESKVQQKDYPRVEQPKVFIP